ATMILVVGATGELGSAIVRRLLGRGERVRALVRKSSDASRVQELRGAGAETVEGDLKDPASLQRACASIEAVVTTANSARRGPPDTVETVDDKGNAALVEAAKKAGVRRFVFVSPPRGRQSSACARAASSTRSSSRTYTWRYGSARSSWALRCRGRRSATSAATANTRSSPRRMWPTS